MNGIKLPGKKCHSEAEGRRILFVASTDLSHYHTDAAWEKDKRTLDLIERKDSEGLTRQLNLEASEMCGSAAALTVLEIARSMGDTDLRMPNKTVILRRSRRICVRRFFAALRMTPVLLGALRISKYANSGDVTGDKERVVGYAAAVLYKKSTVGWTPALAGGLSRSTRPGFRSRASGRAKRGPLTSWEI